MLRRIRSWRPSHTTVAAYMALFIALGGTSYAAVKLPKNSVGSTQIKKNAVSSSKVKNGSLTKSDFKASDLPVGRTGPQGPQGLQGTKGDKGDKGDQGDQGDAGINGTADAFARVQADGTLLPKQPPDNPDFGNTSFNIAQANVDRPSAVPPGVYCIRGLPFKLSSAMVAPDNAGASAAADNDVIVSVAVERGNNINPCDDVAGRPKAQARVVATEADGTPANIDHGFVIWLEGEQ